jgi:hypothetical protein
MKHKRSFDAPINSKNQDVEIRGAKLVSCNDMKCSSIDKFVINEDYAINCYDQYLEIKYNDSKNGYLAEDKPGKKVYQLEDQQAQLPYCKKIKKYLISLF